MVNENLPGTYEFNGSGLSTAERNWGKQRFEDYRTRHHIEKYSDLLLLEELVFTEAIQKRYKKKLKRLATNKKIDEENIVPEHLFKALNTHFERAIVIKEKLGLFTDREENDFYKYIKVIKKKFKKWKEEHLEEREVVCPFCSEIFFLNIRTDKYEASKLKLYHNKVLANKCLWEVYNEGKITKLDMTKILLGEQATSTDYIDWLEEKIFKKDSK